MESTTTVFMESPQGDEIREVEATAAALTPYMAAGWRQVPPPARHETVVFAEEEK